KMDIKRVMTDVLEDLVDKELKQFIWQLCNGVTAGIEPIPRAKLQTSERYIYIYIYIYIYMYIAVIFLKNKDKYTYNGVKQPVQEEVKNSPESMELQPIQSDWLRAYSITACSQQFKHRLLTQERNDVYMPTSSSWRKGSALLINNIKFDRSELNRPGAEIDEENMEWMLRALGYSVEKHTNLSGDAINRAVKNFSKRYEHQNSDSTFVVIMSHGDRFDNKDAILGVHYQRKNPSDYFFVENIFSHLNSVNCSALIDKPKVILIHACRGGDDGGVYVSDSAFESDSWVHKEKDFVCFMSSLPDVCAYRNPHNGSYFFNYIVDVFTTSAHKYDIMELFRRIASRMEIDPRFTHNEKLLPCIERTTLVKKFYLFPGL
uniref:Caspase-1-A-like n=1 Tax=Sinocyclocheilus grahami TaxID=75366 RepID=A0A672LGV4_SINGR